MSYGLMNDNVIYNNRHCSVIERGYIFEKAYPSEPLQQIVFYSVDELENVEDHVKHIVHEYGTQDIADDQLFTINLKGLTVGNYFFGGLLYDSMNKAGEFIKDLANGCIQLAIVNIDKSSGASGILMVDLLHLCKDIKTPIIHVFISHIIAKDILKKINQELGDKYFIKYGNEVFND